jgi:hypothetical protein
METSVAKKVVQAIDEMEANPRPTWNTGSTNDIYETLADKMPGKGVTLDQFGAFIHRFKSTQDYLSEDVKYTKDDWSRQNPETALQVLRKDILAAFPGTRGGRRTRRTRKHRRSSSRKYRSRR